MRTSQIRWRSHPARSSRRIGGKSAREVLEIPLTKRMKLSPTPGEHRETWSIQYSEV